MVDDGGPVGLDGTRVCFDDERAVCDAGVMLVATLAFSRSMQEPQTRLTPPLRRAPPGQNTGIRQAHREGQTNPRFRRHLQLSTLPQRTPRQNPSWPGASGTSSWSPPDAVKPRRFPVAHHDGLQPTQHRAV